MSILVALLVPLSTAPASAAGNASWGTPVAKSGSQPRVMLTADGATAVAAWLDSGTVYLDQGSFSGNIIAWSGTPTAASATSVSSFDVGMNDDGSFLVVVTRSGDQLVAQAGSIGDGTPTLGTTDTVCGSDCSGADPAVSVAPTGTMAATVFNDATHGISVRSFVDNSLTGGQTRVDDNGTGTEPDIALLNDGAGFVVGFKDNEAAPGALKGAVGTIANDGNISDVSLQTLADEGFNVRANGASQGVTGVLTWDDGTKVTAEAVRLVSGTATWGSASDVSAIGTNDTASGWLSRDGSLFTTIYEKFPFQLLLGTRSTAITGTSFDWGPETSFGVDGTRDAVLAGSADGTKLTAVYWGWNGSYNQMYSSSGRINPDGQTAWTASPTALGTGAFVTNIPVVASSTDGYRQLAGLGSGGVWLIPATVAYSPAPPTAVSPEADPFEGGYTITWDPPTDIGNSEVLGYTATGTDGSSCFALAPTVSCRVNNVRPGRKIRYTVTAANSIGESFPSAPSSRVALVSTGSCTVPGTGTSCSASGLSDGHSYVFTASSHNPDAGWGATSIGSNTIVVDDEGQVSVVNDVADQGGGDVTTQEDPASPVLDNVSGQQNRVAVSWSAGDDASAIVRYYAQVNIFDEDGTDPQEWYRGCGVRPSAPELACTIRSLPYGATIQVRVQAVDDQGGFHYSDVTGIQLPGQGEETWTLPDPPTDVVAGDGGPNTADVSFTLGASEPAIDISQVLVYDLGPTVDGFAAADPTQPLAVTASLRSPTGVTVTWRRPDWDGNAPISRYEVTGEPGGSCTVPGDGTVWHSCDIDGLTPGTSYRFRVSAHTRGDAKSVSDWATIRLPAAAPVGGGGGGAAITDDPVIESPSRAVPPSPQRTAAPRRVAQPLKASRITRATRLPTGKVRVRFSEPAGGTKYRLTCTAPTGKRSSTSGASSPLTVRTGAARQRCRIQTIGRGDSVWSQRVVVKPTKNRPAARQGRSR